MSVMTEVGAYLESQGIGVVNTTLFLGRLPPQTEGNITAMALTPYPGMAPSFLLDGTAEVRTDYPRVQFQSRAETEALAFANAEAAYLVLAKVANKLLSGTLYLSINVLQSPGILRYDADDKPIVGFNFECERAL